MAVERVGVSFEPELLKKYDALIESKGYGSRSEAIRDLVRESLIKAETGTGSGNIIGTLTIIYDHDVGNVTNRLLHIQHHHHDEISSTIHIHIDEHNCLEVLVVRGRVDEVRKLADSIKAIKGVKYGELVMASASF